MTKRIFLKYFLFTLSKSGLIQNYVVSVVRLRPLYSQLKRERRRSEGSAMYQRTMTNETLTTGN